MNESPGPPAPPPDEEPESLFDEEPESLFDGPLFLDDRPLFDEEPLFDKGEEPLFDGPLFVDDRPLFDEPGADEGPLFDPDD